MKIALRMLVGAACGFPFATAAAQDTYTWPDAAYPDFYDLVVNIMAPGDSLVMLADASYPHSQPLFVREIEIFAPTEVTITSVAVDRVFERPVAFFDRARVKNVRFEWDDAGFDIVRNFGAEGGQSYFDTCTFVGSTASGAGDDGGSAFRHCPFGPSTFIGCTFLGGDGGDAVAGTGETVAGDGGHGLEIDSDPCTLVSCQVVGGRGGDGVDPGCLGDDLIAGNGGDGLRGDFREPVLEPSTLVAGAGGQDLDCVDGTDDGADGTDLLGTRIPITGYTYAISSGPGGIVSMGSQGYTGFSALFVGLGTTASPGDLHGLRDVYSLDSTAFRFITRRGDVFLGGPYDPLFTGTRLYFQVLNLDPATGELSFDPSASIHLLDH